MVCIGVMLLIGIPHRHDIDTSASLVFSSIRPVTDTAETTYFKLLFFLDKVAGPDTRVVVARSNFLSRLRRRASSMAGPSLLTPSRAPPPAGPS